MIRNFDVISSYFWEWSSRDYASSSNCLLLVILDFEEYKSPTTSFGDRNFGLVLIMTRQNHRIQFALNEVLFSLWEDTTMYILWGHSLTFRSLWSPFEKKTTTSNEMGRWWSFSQISFTSVAQDLYPVLKPNTISSPRKSKTR